MALGGAANRDVKIEKGTLGDSQRCITSNARPSQLPDARPTQLPDARPAQPPDARPTQPPVRKSSQPPDQHPHYTRELHVHSNTWEGSWSPPTKANKTGLYTTCTKKAVSPKAKQRHNYSPSHYWTILGHLLATSSLFLYTFVFTLSWSTLSLP
jgi:hypothetical protein